ncbi:MAG: hypothetical protein WED81_06025 [Rhodothermales bacterium]
MRTSFIRAAACIFMLATIHVSDAAAQMFSYDRERPRPVQSISFGYTVVAFHFNGSGIPNPSFEYDGPIYGAVYTRPNMVATLGYGADDSDRDLRLLDASITTWGEIRLSDSRRGRLYVPIGLHTNYRRVAPRGEEDSLVDSFNITVLGLGSGIGYHLYIGDALVVSFRAMPIIGLALRAFGDSAGSSRLLDASVHVHRPKVIGRFGFSAGYGFRTQVWNVGASSLVPQGSDDVFDYAGNHHVLMIGVNW